MIELDALGALSIAAHPHATKPNLYFSTSSPSLLK
jgi:hypothetical protein